MVLSVLVIGFVIGGVVVLFLAMFTCPTVLFVTSALPLAMSLAEMSLSAEVVDTEGFVTSTSARLTLSLVTLLLEGTVFAKSASPDVVDEAGCGATRSTVVAKSVVDCCAVVQVKIVNPDSVVSANVPRPTN